MSRSYRTDEQRSRRGKAVAVIVLVLIVVGGWIAVVAAMSSGQSPPAGERDSGSGERAAGDDSPGGGETTASAPESGEQQGSADSEDESTTPEPAPSVETPPAERGTWAQGDTEGTPPAVAAARAATDSGADDARSAEEGGERRNSSEGSGDSSGGEGEENQIEGLDPLGKDPAPNDLTDTERERATAAADRFITAAFGYTGDSSAQYRDGLEEGALLPGLYTSPGGDRIQQYQKAAGEEGGVNSAAVMDRFEITATTTEPKQVEGVAYFRVAASYNQNAELQGKTTAFKQELTLSPTYSTYKVATAEVEQQIASTGRKEGS